MAEEVLKDYEEVKRLKGELRYVSPEKVNSLKKNVERIAEIATVNKNQLIRKFAIGVLGELMQHPKPEIHNLAKRMYAPFSVRFNEDFAALKGSFYPVMQNPDLSFDEKRRKLDYLEKLIMGTDFDYPRQMGKEYLKKIVDKHPDQATRVYAKEVLGRVEEFEIRRKREEDLFERENWTIK